MGEWSRKIGEIGEDIVGEFFDLVGWSDSQKGLELQCVRGARHKTTSAGPRRTHGLDYLFSYESQLSHRTLDHLVVSVKYTMAPYPASPNAKFKEHFLDLARAMECFKSSEIRQSANSQFSGVDRARDIGVLFWLSHEALESEDLLQKISKVRGVDVYDYGSIYVVDNRRVSFIYDVIQYLRRAKPKSEIEFFYPNTGKNYNSIERESSGKVLPVEFINSSVLPLRLVHADSSSTFVVASADKFDRDTLKRLMGLSLSMSLDLTKDTLIVFPDFEGIRHENQVNAAKSSFKDKRFTESVRVLSYRTDFRTMSDE